MTARWTWIKGAALAAPALLALSLSSPTAWAGMAKVETAKTEVWSTEVATAPDTTPTGDEKGAQRPSGQTDKVAVLMNLSNNELIDIAQRCAKAGAMRATLIGLMTSWETAWPVFKQAWDDCIDKVVEQTTGDQDRADRVGQLKKLEQSDFEVRVRQLSQ